LIAQRKKAFAYIKGKKIRYGEDHYKVKGKK